MILLIVNNNITESETTFEIPENAKEMRLRQFIDFTKYYDKWIAITKESGIFSYESIIGLSTILSKFFEVEIEDLLGIEIDYNDIAAGVQKLTEKEVQDNEVAPKLMQIVVFIKRVIDNVMPRELTSADHSFEYKGEVYDIPFFSAYEYLQTKARPTLVLGEIVEIHEVKRKFSDFKDKQIAEAEKEGNTKFVYDPEGNYMLEESLRILSILAIKRGESRLPSYDTENFIAQRMWHFIDIDLQAWADVSFFLTCIGKELNLTKDSITSLILLNELLNHQNNLN